MNGMNMEQEPKRTVGQWLRSARVSRGISREEAAAATRIKPVFLVAMEEDDYQRLPDERYVLRFLGDYARFLDLDPQGVLECFSQQIARDHGSLAVFPVKRAVTLSVRRLAPALLLLAFLIPSVFVTLSLLDHRPPVGQAPQRAARPAGETTPRGAPSATRETVAAHPVEVAAPTLPESPEPSEARVATSILRVKAREMTWMLVTIDGRATRDVLLQAGETWEWRAQEGFVVTIGNAGGVELMVNGRPLPRLGEAGEVIRDLRLPAEETSTLDLR
jgi:hypothetical protein